MALVSRLGLCPGRVAPPSAARHRLPAAPRGKARVIEAFVCDGNRGREENQGFTQPLGCTIDWLAGRAFSFGKHGPFGYFGYFSILSPYTSLELYLRCEAGLWNGQAITRLLSPKRAFLLWLGCDLTSDLSDGPGVR